MACKNGADRLSGNCIDDNSIMLQREWLARMERIDYPTLEMMLQREWLARIERIDYPRSKLVFVNEAAQWELSRT